MQVKHNRKTQDVTIKRLRFGRLPFSSLSSFLPHSHTRPPMYYSLPRSSPLSPAYLNIYDSSHDSSHFVDSCVPVDSFPWLIQISMTHSSRAYIYSSLYPVVALACTSSTTTCNHIASYSLSSLPSLGLVTSSNKPWSIVKHWYKSYNTEFPLELDTRNQIHQEV